jgi:hypothetical protein
MGREGGIQSGSFGAKGWGQSRWLGMGLGNVSV